MKRIFMHGGNIKEIARSFGIKESRVVDFSANINPSGLPSGIEKLIRCNIKNISHYPDTQNTEFKAVLSECLSVNSKNIVVGNGSTELIYQAVYALKPKGALIISPTFSEYEKALINIGTKIKFLRLKEKDEFNVPIKEIIEKADENDMMFLCNPNNPTGKMIEREVLILLSKELRRKKVMLVLDEAFIDLAEENSLVDIAAGNDYLFVLRSLTKFFGLPGLRLGYGVGSGKLINKLKDFRQPWSVNVFAQVVGEKLVQDIEFRRKSKKLLLKEKEFLYQRLSQIKALKPYSSCTNFIFIKILVCFSSLELQKRLLKRSILIRDCSNFRGLNGKFIRVAVRSRKENIKLVRELCAIFSKK